MRTSSILLQGGWHGRMTGLAPLVAAFAVAIGCTDNTPARTAAAPEPVSIDLSTTAGVSWQFKPENGDWKAINVPAGGWRAQGYTCDAGTYRASIPIPAAAKGQVVRVNFDAVNFGADVYVGPDADHLIKVASHVDGWVPVIANVTAHVQPGAPLLVQVDVKGRKKFMLNGKYTVPEGATWDPYLEEGILRGVHLQILPPVYIERVFVRPNVNQDTIASEVTVTNTTAHPVSVTVRPRLSSWNGTKYRYPALHEAAAPIPAGATTTLSLGPTHWGLGSGSYWWPNVPYRAGYHAQLHNLDLDLLVDGKLVEHSPQRFGFRQFEVRGNHYTLNGIHCNLRGDNQQEADFGTDAYGIRPGFGPPTAGNPGWPKAVDNLLRLNFNVMRIHQVPATPYMLDACDELGLMLVEESPIRGSEGGEDFRDAPDNFLNMDRELVQRDRNHPAVVIWSAANEWGEPIPKLVPVIQAVDDTRPIIADGVGDLGPAYINMQHYVNWGGPPYIGGTPRQDRPYGETESVWPHDNSWQGFAWMATGTRLRRLKGDADIRNYVLNNAWSNYVPGENADNEVLEVRVKGSPDAKILPALEDPWHHPNILLMQKCYNPVAVCDEAFDMLNKGSDASGAWPVMKLRVQAGTHVVRTLSVFNDEFTGQDVKVVWAFHAGTKTGPVLASGNSTLSIPLGEFRRVDASFDAPKEAQTVILVVTSSKGGQERFQDDLPTYQVVTDATHLVPDGSYQLVNKNSGLVAGPVAAADFNGAQVVQQTASASARQVWQLTNLGHDDVRLKNKETGMALDIKGGAATNDTLAIESPPGDSASQVWHLEPAGDGCYTLTNKKTGKVLDVFSSATGAGARIVQWDLNGGANQQWMFK